MFLANKLSENFARQILRVDEFPVVDAVQEARLLLQAVYRGRRLEETWSVSPGVLNDEERMAKSQLFSAILDAAVAHEIGHILEFRTRRNSELQQLKREIQSMMNPRMSRRSMQTKERWEAEFRADTTAAAILPKPLAFWEFGGPQCLMVLLDILCMIERGMGGPYDTDTHPSAEQRRARLLANRPNLDQDHIMVRRLGQLCRAVQP